MIYHTAVFYDDLTNINRIHVQFILFLSKMLTSAKQRYWSIEFEIAALVWIIKKVKHMIETITKTTVIFTNHSVSTSIVKQISHIFSNIDKLNLKLIKVFVYLSQFDLDVRYKSKKFNIVFDVLFRLFTISSLQSFSKKTNAFQISLIIMSNEFKKRLIDEYAKDASWTKIIKALQELEKRLKKERNLENASRYNNNHIDMNFVIRQELIYHKNRQRLCIFKSFDKDIFNLTHDKNQHSEINRCYARISECLYISHLLRKLRQYVTHCFQCQLNQIKRHKSYEKLMLISSTSKSFHTISIDFVMTIFEDFDSLLTAFCKFFKRVMIISKKFIYSAEKWVELAFDRFQLTDWEISAAIIFDRDFKFIFEFWRNLFKRFDVDLLTFIFYHAQTDEQSKRTNQIVKIAIRFLITINIDIIFVLSCLQTQLNNFSNASTKRSSNEIVYDFKMRKIIFKTSFMKNISEFRLEHRQNATNAIFFANAHMKIKYDVRHKSLLLHFENKVYLRFHKKYEIIEQHKKLNNQRCESFLITRRVDRFAYELNISLKWKIYSVVSVTQLEFATFHQNLYNRSRSDHSNSVYVEDDTKTEKFYEMKAIVDKRIKKFEKTSITQYKIKWLEYDLEFDEWRFIFKLNCMNLIEKYEKNQRKRWRHFQKDGHLLRALHDSTSWRAHKHSDKPFAASFNQKRMSSAWRLPSDRRRHGAYLIKIA